MKFSIKPDGTFEFDDVTAAEAVELARQAKAPVAPAPPPRSTMREVVELITTPLIEAAERPNSVQYASTIPGTASMSDIWYKTWVFLVDNDHDRGVAVSAVSRHFGCSDSAAHSRLMKLVKNGYAKRVSRGFYRALSG